MNLSIAYLFAFSLFCFCSFEARPSVGIFGGEDAKPNEFPSILSVQVSIDGEDFQHFCGGTLLDNSTVLTAAYTIINLLNKFPKARLRVVAGAHDLKIQTGLERYANVRLVIVHDNFIHSGGVGQCYDIAILKLRQTIVEESHIQYAKLPGSPTDPQSESEGITAGWGLTENGIKTVLQKVTLTLSSDSQCQQSAVRTNPPTCSKKEMFFCTIDKVKNKNINNGDNGGPFYQGNVVVGISNSFVSNMNIPQVSVYTRVGGFLEWIEKSRV